MQLYSFYSPTTGNVLKIIFLLLLLLVLSSAATIPFLWESTSLWYKFGTDKIILQLGKVAGLFAATLLFFQILLASRLTLFDRITGLDRVYFLHQFNAFIIIGLAVVHVSLVIIPEGIDNLPIGWKFWPEMIGAATLFLLIVSVIVARERRRILPYHIWRMIHRPMGYLLVIGMNIHVLTVSDSFKQDMPRLFFFILAGIVLFSVAARALKNMVNPTKSLEIQEITPLTDSVISLQIAAPPTFSYAPGQFAFVRFSGPSVSAEPHPFTIASSPGNHTLQFMIKKCGDWTSELELDTETSARVSLEGPYGLFSYKAKTPASHIVFIAGGIGITPMISMLRHIAAEKRQPRLLLLWSLRLKNEAFLQDELESLKEEIASLDVRLLFTREKSGERIDKKLLEHLLRSFPDSSHFYICGPEQMMVKTRGILHELGFQDKKIYWERFSL